ncbi:MAG TPA: DUF1206 domain-containing protein, partial [Cytophagales bacterium]|nr:DUF1206 domain-containing protein [Cytophagales bacterium]
MNTIIGTIGTHKEKWLENFARFGIASKGVVYCLLGLLAFLGAVGAGQKNPDKKDVFGFIVEQPFGKVLLAIVGLGLLGYAIWRFIQSFKDPEHTGNDKKGVIKRIGYGVSALIYTGLSFYAISLVLNRRTGGGDTKQHIVDKLLDMNGGAWIVGIVGLIIIIRGLVQIYNAYTGKFKDHIHHDGELFDKAGKIGYT